MEKWSEADEKLLRENFLQKNREELLRLFPNRTWHALHSRATLLGVKGCSVRHFRSSLELICSYCGAGFRRKKSAIRSELKFCSKECSSEFHKTSLEQKFWSKIQKGLSEIDCWKWIGTKDNLGRYGIIGSGNAGHYLAHRVSFEIHNKIKIPKGRIVLHTCDNTECTNPLHLRLGTQLENIHDCIQKGRFLKGAASPNSKLSWEQILEIRKLYTNNHLTYDELSCRFNVCKQTICNIILNRTYQNGPK